MSKKEANHFSKSLYSKLVENQEQTEKLFEQIFLNTVNNIENMMTEEEAEQKMASELVNYSVDISKHFRDPKDKEIAQGVIPYIMLEYVMSVQPQEIIDVPEQIDIDKNKDQNDFDQKFVQNLQKLKPKILEKVAKHWRSIAEAASLGGIAYIVTKFLIGYPNKKAFLISGGLSIALFIALEVYQKFTKME